MRPLALTLARASGRGRALLVVATTALSSALLLVAVSIARLSDEPTTYTCTSSCTDDARGRLSEIGYSAGGLIGPLQESGTRGGAVFGVVLLVVPLLLLLDQAVRLGSSSRHRRYAALAVAGATRADLRRWGAFEVGLPATAGALLGIPLWWLLRNLLGTRLTHSGNALVPTGTGPGAWAVLVLAAITAYGVLVGVRSGARVPALLCATRRLRPAPRPSGLLVLLVAALLLVPAFSATSELGFIAELVLVVLGLALLSPWLAHRVALGLVGHARSGEMLLALRRLIADPGPPGRAAAATGAVALAGGVIGPLVGDFRSSGLGGADDYYVLPTLLAAILAIIAAGIVAATLAIHSTETVLERRRELAALVATGVPPSTISRSQLLEVWVATLPLATLAALLGSFGYWVLGGMNVVLLWPVASTVTTIAVIAGAGWATHRLARPWVRDAVQPANLRTE